MDMPWYGVDSTLGLMLAEAAGALAANSQRGAERIRQISDAGDVELTSKVLAEIEADVAQQNADIAMSFYEIFVSRGMAAEASMALAWANDNSARATILISAIERAENGSNIDDVIVSSLSGLDNIGEAFGGDFPRVFRNTFGIIDAGYTIGDLVKAYKNGDGTQIAAIAVSSAVGAALGVLATAAVGALGLVGAPAVIVLGVLGGLAWAVSDELKDGINALLEAFPGVAEDEEDVASRVRKAITESGSSGTKYIGYKLFFGDESDDYLRGDESAPNSMSGGLGDDVIHGGMDGDYLSGGDGADILKGGGGDDVIRGGKGNDRIEGGGGE